ncbi:MAG: hypothetical protein ACXACY_30900 [Candidatus Hodarchaeales archaeon]|jgi:hypothetical protein
MVNIGAAIIKTAGAGGKMVYFHRLKTIYKKFERPYTQKNEPIFKGYSVYFDEYLNSRPVKNGKILADIDKILNSSDFVEYEHSTQDVGDSKIVCLVIDEKDGKISEVKGFKIEEALKTFKDKVSESRY